MMTYLFLFAMIKKSFRVTLDVIYYELNQPVGRGNSLGRSIQIVLMTYLIKKITSFAALRNLALRLFVYLVQQEHQERRLHLRSRLARQAHEKAPLWPPNL